MTNGTSNGRIWKNKFTYFFGGGITGIFHPNLACVWVFRPSPLLLPLCRLAPQTVLEV